MSEQEALCDDRLADRIDALAGAASMCDSPEALELLRDNLLDLARNVRTTRPPAAPVSDAKEWRVGILRPDLLEDDPPPVSDAKEREKLSRAIGLAESIARIPGLGYEVNKQGVYEIAAEIVELLHAVSGEDR